MTQRRFWNGSGELQDGECYWTKNDGTLVGRPYVRQRAQSALSGRLFTPAQRREALRRTVDNDEWLGCRNLELVAAVCRDVVSVAFDVWSEDQS